MLPANDAFQNCLPTEYSHVELKSIEMLPAELVEVLKTVHVAAPSLVIEMLKTMPAGSAVPFVSLTRTIRVVVCSPVVSAIELLPSSNVNIKVSCCIVKICWLVSLAGFNMSFAVSL